MRRNSKLLLTPLVLALMLPLLGACATTQMGSGATNTLDFYCGKARTGGAYHPVHWSKTDTDQTISEVKANNAVFKRLCG